MLLAFALLVTVRPEKQPQGLPATAVPDSVPTGRRGGDPVATPAFAPLLSEPHLTPKPVSPKIHSAAVCSLWERATMHRGDDQ